MLNEDREYCHRMLPKVSRTFAPSIRMLSENLQMPVTVAYLLCRVADTIEDSRNLTVKQKRSLLNQYCWIFNDDTSTKLDHFVNQIAVLPVTSADEELVHNLPIVMNVFYSFSEMVQKHIAFWVVEMSSGMHKYAQSYKKRHFQFLKTMNELDEYMYYVAGTVGYLLTELFSLYSKVITPQLKSKLEQFAESFGKGLQMVNIIRDISTDLNRGQSYIPDELLEKYCLDRQSIYEVQNSDRVEEMFSELIFTAIRHMDRALVYVLLIPKKEKRIRLFCMLPLFWAMRTLQKIQKNTLALLGNEKIKISRQLIRKEFLLAVLHNNSNWLTHKYYLSIRKHFRIPVLSGTEAFSEE